MMNMLLPQRKKDYSTFRIDNERETLKKELNQFEKWMCTNKIGHEEAMEVLEEALVGQVWAWWTLVKEDSERLGRHPRRDAQRIRGR